MSNLLTALYRTPHGIIGVLSSRRSPFEEPAPQEAGEQFDGPTFEQHTPYIAETQPLTEISNQDCINKKVITDAWAELKSVRDFDHRTLANIQTILSETITDPMADTSGIPQLEFTESPPPPKATAAHPRAYKGTKYRPPKPAQQAAIDLRPHLSIPASVDRILEKLPHLIQADDPSNGNNLTGLAENQQQVASLPIAFRRDIYWPIRHQPWELITSALGAYWALDLENNQPLRTCIGLLFSFEPTNITVNWCKIIAHIPVHRRIHFAELLGVSPALHQSPDKQVIEDIIRIDTLSTDESYRHRIHYAFNTISRNHDLTYALDGMLLANKWKNDYHFDAVASITGVAAAVSRFAEHVYTPGDWNFFGPLDIWKRSSQLDGIPDFLNKLNWERLAPNNCEEFVRILTNIIYDDLDDRTLADKWAMIKKISGHLFQLVEKTEIPYRHKALAIIYEYIWSIDNPETMHTNLSRLSHVIDRTCHRALTTSEYSSAALASLISLLPEHWTAIAESPDTSYKKLDSSTVRKNEGLLIGDGLYSLCRDIPELAAAGFAQFTGQLVNAAKTLGVLNDPTRNRVIQNFLNHPVWPLDMGNTPPKGLLELVEKHIQPGMSNPISRRLREHLQGSRTMNHEQVSRDTKNLHQNWPGFQLDVLTQIALDQMSQGMPDIDLTGKVRHAIMIQQVSEENRRSLRRMLKEYLGGHEDCIDNHPQNLQWLKNRSNLNLEAWHNGITLREEVRETGPLKLELEKDPLEVLRLGTYLGTCLGIGGICSYSCASIALDVNKQVIYAKNSTGSVVARQIIAISEDNLLVCFSVYPEKSSPEVKKLFKEYDQRFAETLGVNVFLSTDNENQETYKIASLISQGFWDDNHWNLDTKPD